MYGQAKCSTHLSHSLTQEVPYSPAQYKVWHNIAFHSSHEQPERGLVHVV